MTCGVFSKYIEAFGMELADEASKADIIVCYEHMIDGCEEKKKILITADPFAYGNDTLRLPLSATKLKKVLLEEQGGDLEAKSHIDMARAGSMAKVLVADDNKTNQKLITALFKKHGYEAVIANDGEEAVALFSSKRYPLVLLDIQMPKMDGIEAMKVIKQIEPNAQVIALTANAGVGDKERFLADGFDDYLQKPINEKELFGVLGSYYDNSVNTYMAMLEDTLGLDRDEIKSLLEDFVLDSTMEIMPMRDAIASGDLGSLFGLAHKIKGAAANLRLDSVQKVAYDIEQNAKNGVNMNYEELLHLLEREIIAINYKGV